MQLETIPEVLVVINPTPKGTKSPTAFALMVYKLCSFHSRK